MSDLQASTGLGVLIFAIGVGFISFAAGTESGHKEAAEQAVSPAPAKWWLELVGYARVRREVSGEDGTK